MGNYVLVRVGSMKRNYKKPKVYKSFRTKKDAEKGRTKFYKTNLGKKERLWMYNKKLNRYY